MAVRTSTRIMLAVLFALIAAFFLTTVIDNIGTKSGIDKVGTKGEVGHTETNSGVVNDGGDIFNCSSRAAAQKFSSRKECEDFRTIWQTDQIKSNEKER
ncbi:MAG: hypothetical protein WCF66_14360 [Pseudolabrys sp.]